MKIIQSELLRNFGTLTHAFSTRKQNLVYGGNLAYHVGDKIDNVERNHFELAKQLNYPLEKLAYMNQVHGDKIAVIKKQNILNSPITADAIITQEIDTPLMVMVADCIPILIYDRVAKAIGVVHAGRAGIFLKILPKTIEKMQNEYGTKVENVFVVLGPSIHKCCYEISKQIADEASDRGFEYAVIKKDNRYYLDLLSIAQEQLKEIGVPSYNVESSGYCTSCTNDLFFSYRAENRSCGRFSGIIMLKK